MPAAELFQGVLQLRCETSAVAAPQCGYLLRRIGSGKFRSLVTGKMLAETSFHIGGYAGIQLTIPTAENVNVIFHTFFSYANTARYLCGVALVCVMSIPPVGFMRYLLCKLTVIFSFGSYIIRKIKYTYNCSNYRTYFKKNRAF